MIILWHQNTHDGKISSPKRPNFLTYTSSNKTTHKTQMRHMLIVSYTQGDEDVYT